MRPRTRSPRSQINSLFPHQIAARCSEQGKRFIHISTDCVFSGSRGGFLYGGRPTGCPATSTGAGSCWARRSSRGALTLRTSIIGRELASSYGLVEWFLGEVFEGNRYAASARRYSAGLTTEALADTLIEVVTDHVTTSRALSHVSAEPIDKNRPAGDVARRGTRFSVTIVPDDSVRSGSEPRTRAGSATATGWRPPSWQEMVDSVWQPIPRHTNEIRRSSIASAVSEFS